MKGQGPRRRSSPKTEPDFYTMTCLPSSTPCVAARQANEQPLRVNEVAIIRGFGPVERGYANMSLHAPSSSMAIALQLPAFSDRNGFSSNGESMSCLALHCAAAQRWNSLPPLTPSALAEALALCHHQRCMSLAMPAAPALGDLPRSEQHNLARALVWQSIIARYRAGHDDPTLVLVQRFLQHQTQNGEK